MVSKPADDGASARPRPRHWSETPERGNATWVAIGTFLATLLGRRVSLRPLYLVAAYFFLSGPQARRHARAYLRRVLPHEPRSGDVFRLVYTFATTILDRLYLTRERYDFFGITSEGGALMGEEGGGGGGGFLVGGDRGRFERG